MPFPRSYYEDATAGILIIEDLSETGYEMRPATVGLNAEHCEAVLTALARLHAFGHKLVRMQMRAT